MIVTPRHCICFICAEKKREGRSKADREADDQQFLQLMHGSGWSVTDIKGVWKRMASQSSKKIPITRRLGYP